MRSDNDIVRAALAQANKLERKAAYGRGHITDEELAACVTVLRACADEIERLLPAAVRPAKTKGPTA